jgi:DUF1680 family protein
VYCVEQCDQAAPLERLYLPPDAKLEPEARPRLLGGVTVLRGQAGAVSELDWDRRLYGVLPALRRVELVAIPYFAWDNREPGPMKVWLPLAPPLWTEPEGK